MLCCIYWFLGRVSDADLRELYARCRASSFSATTARWLDERWGLCKFSETTKVRKRAIARRPRLSMVL
jgi:hypothetical protein